METKVVSPKTFIYNEGTTTLRKIMDYSKIYVDALLKKMDEAGLEAAGPMEFIYFGACSDPDKEFTLQIAVPVKEEKPVGKGYNYKKAEPFKCFTYEHKGEITDLHDAYEKAFGEVYARQLEPNNEIREVYKVYENLSSPNNLTEIQIGVN